MSLVRLSSTLFVVLAFCCLGCSTFNPSSGMTVERPHPPQPMTSQDSVLYDVVNFGAKGNDSPDDGPAFQAALQLAQTHQGIVSVPCGVYRIGSPIAVTSSNVTIRGAAPGCAVLKPTPEFSGTVLSAGGNIGLPNGCALGADAREGDATITVQDRTHCAFDPGDYLFLYQALDNTTVYGFLTKVRAQEGLAITLTDPVPLTALVPLGYQVYKISMLSNVVFENLVIDGSLNPALGNTVVLHQFCVSCGIRNMIIRNIHSGYYPVGLYLTYGERLDQIAVTPAPLPNASGLHSHCSSHFQVSDYRVAVSINAWGGNLSSSHYGTIDHYEVVGEDASLMSGRAFKLSTSTHNTISHFAADAIGSTGMTLEKGASYNTFSYLLLSNIGNSSNYGAGFVSMGNANKFNQVSNTKLSNVAGTFIESLLPTGNPTSLFALPLRTDDGRLQSGASYCYRVSSHDQFGNESEASPQVCVDLSESTNAVQVTWNRQICVNKESYGYTIYGRMAGNNAALATVYGVNHDEVATSFIDDGTRTPTGAFSVENKRGDDGLAVAYSELGPSAGAIYHCCNMAQANGNDLTFSDNRFVDTTQNSVNGIVFQGNRNQALRNIISGAGIYDIAISPGSIQNVVIGNEMTSGFYNAGESTIVCSNTGPAGVAAGCNVK